MRNININDYEFKNVMTRKKIIEIARKREKLKRSKQNKVKK